MTQIGLALVDEDGAGLGPSLGLHNLVNRHLQDLKVLGDGKLYSGHLDSEEEFTLFVDDLKALGFSFSTENSKIYKQSRILFSSSMRRNSEFKIPYFGSPFQIIKSSYLLCSQGGNYKPQLLSPMQPGHQPSKKRRFSLQPTKKIGCKALMTVKCIRIFSEDCYKAKSSIYKDGSYENRLIMSKLNKDLLSSCPPTGTIRFMVVMSTADEHNHTVVSTNLNQILHPRLREEIHKCAESSDVGLCSVNTMKTHLREFVRCMFEGEDRPQPDRLNRCYYPTDTSLRFHMRQAGFKIARKRKRQTTDCVTGVENINIDIESQPPIEIDVQTPEVADIGLPLQMQPTVYTTQTIKREKTALEQCIILRRVVNSGAKPNLDVDVIENQDYCDVQLDMQPNVFMIENIADTPLEKCIIVQRGPDCDDQSSSDMDDGSGGNIFEFCSEGEVEEEVISNSLDEKGTFEYYTQDNATDLKTLVDETRENLKTMVRYTYLLHSPESILEIAHLTRQLKDQMQSSVLKTSNQLLLDPTDLNMPSRTERNVVESITKKYYSLPKRSQLRNNGKYVD